MSCPIQSTEFVVVQNKVYIFMSTIQNFEVDTYKYAFATNQSSIVLDIISHIRSGELLDNFIYIILNINRMCKKISI